MILSPRAVERFNTFKPPRAIPKIFRLAPKGKLDLKIFSGSVINTISLLAIEDLLGVMKWSKSVGGNQGLIDRTDANLAAVTEFVDKTPWIDFLCQDEALRSSTSVCLTLDLPADKVKALAALLNDEGVAYDIGAYKNAPPGLRIWCGATVETADVEKLMPWIEWAYHEVSAQ